MRGEVCSVLHTNRLEGKMDVEGEAVDGLGDIASVTFRKSEIFI
jgi:hypothetical protein